MIIICPKKRQPLQQCSALPHSRGVMATGLLFLLIPMKLWLLFVWTCSCHLGSGVNLFA